MKRRILAALLLSLCPWPYAIAYAQSAQTMVASRDFDCIMEARVIVKLGTSVTGLISQVLVDRGDTVKQGQVVARLESGVQEAIVALARMRATNEYQIRSHQSRKEFLSKKLERVKTLQSRDYASVAALDEVISDLRVSESSEQEAKLGFEVAKLELERETEVLSQRQIKSPISGVVMERVLFSGEYRNENNHLMTIAQIDPLHIEVVVPISYFGQLKIGSEGVIRPEEPVGGEFTAKVTVIDRVLDAASGTFGVRLELRNPENILPAGIRCSVRFK